MDFLLVFVIQVSLDAMFDVQTKRIHQYKRQLLNILGIIHRYDCIKVTHFIPHVISLIFISLEVVVC